MKTLLLLLIAAMVLNLALLFLHWGVWIYANTTTIETIYKADYNEDTMILKLYPEGQRHTQRRFYE